MTAYYNEIDPFAAAWLRELIKAGHIAPGEVDERSIADVVPSDLAGFTQCHFFAGIGVWSYALRQAGWPDDRPVWTCSCPCQPFSSAGKGKGFKDERHLWPEFYRLISQCRPPVCFGEQVASKDGLAWLDLVQTDMESSDYAFGAVDTCAAGFGAPHIRQRLYWVGDANYKFQSPAGNAEMPTDHHRTSIACGMGNSIVKGLEGYAGDGNGSHKPGWDEKDTPRSVAAASGSSRLAHAESAGRTDGEEISGSSRQVSCAGKPLLGVGDCSTACERPGPTNGFWGAADWLLCRDEKWRATQSIVVKMADGLADRLGYSRFGDRWSLNPLIQKAENRVGRLKGYGNAINAEQAKAFIEAFMEVDL